MNISLKDKQQLAVYVGAFNFPFEHPGLAIMFAVANGGVDPMKSWKLPWRPRSDALTKRAHRCGGTGQIENPTGDRSHQRQQPYRWHRGQPGHRPRTARETRNWSTPRWIDTLALTREDLQRAATTYFVAENRVVLHYLPIPPHNP